MPVFGPTSLGSIEPEEDVAVWIAGFKGKGRLGPSRVDQAFTVLNSVLNLAVDYGRLYRNPASVRAIKQSLPKAPLREMHFLNLDEVMDLAEAIGDEYRTLILHPRLGA